MLLELLLSEIYILMGVPPLSCEFLSLVTETGSAEVVSLFVILP